MRVLPFLKGHWKNASLGDMTVMLGTPALYSYLIFNSFYRRDVPESPNRKLSGSSPLSLELRLLLK